MKSLIAELFDEITGPTTNHRYQIETEKFGTRSYKKKVVNKWRLIVFLIKNPILIIDRKHNLIKCKTDCEKKSFFKNFLNSLNCGSCKKKSNNEDNENLIFIEQ